MSEKTIEAKKIADCLTSLDNIIVAENKKLDILKTHKKGLIQKLLPAESNLDKVISAQVEKIEILNQYKKGLLQGLFPSAQEVME